MITHTEPGGKLRVLLIVVLLPGLYCFFAPLVLSTDSLYGFLAYKGSMQTGTFNVIDVVSEHNINQFRKLFVSWWSPGQWIVPGLINYVTGIRLGLASIITTVLFSAAGMWGYYRIFNYYGFPIRITAVSLLIIFFSSNFNYSYIVYQGGETLSFGIFPWFFLYVMKTRKATFLRIVLITLFFLACFIAKTTMIIYCSLVLLYKLTEPSVDLFTTRRRIKLPSARHFLFALPVLASMLLIYFFFLSKGTIPTVVNSLGVSAQDILVPLASPVTGLLSVQTAIASAGRYFAAHTSYSHLIVAGIFLVCTAITFWCGYLVLCNKLINPEYKRVVILLYAGLSAFFIFSYIMNTNIDYSSRHLKLLSFLCIPAFLMAGINISGARYVYSALCLVAIINIFYFFRLKQKLTADRYVSVQYFYRNNDKLQDIDSMDRESYQKLLAINKRYTGIKSPVLYYIESNPDVALDIPERCIIPKQDTSIANAVYRGRGPVVIACVSKKTLEQYPGMLRQKFPDCGDFRVLDETERYRYLIAGELPR